MKKAALVLSLILAALALAACGGGGSSSSSSEETGGGATVEAEAEENGAGAVEAEAKEKTPSEVGNEIEEHLALIEANPSGKLAFEEKEITLPAGEETITMINRSKTPHNVAIEDSSGKVIGETETAAGGSTGFTTNLKPGTYTFFCSVPGHRQAGMEGKLVVK